MYKQRRVDGRPIELATDRTAPLPPPPPAAVPTVASARQPSGCRVAHALRHYRESAGWEVARWERNLAQLSERHRAMVPRLPAKVGCGGTRVVNRLNTRSVQLTCIGAWYHGEGAGLPGGAPRHNTPTRPPPLSLPLPHQIAEARQCIYRNHLFISTLLSMFEEDSEDCPPHLAPANAAADEHEARAGGAVAPGDQEKVRWGGA